MKALLAAAVAALVVVGCASVKPSRARQQDTPARKACRQSCIDDGMTPYGYTEDDARAQCICEKKPDEA